MVGWFSIHYLLNGNSSTDVAVLDGRHIRHGLRAIGTIQVVAQDRDDGAVGARADIDPALTRSLDAIGAVAAHQTEDAETGAEALLGVRFGGEDQLHQVRCGGTDPGGLRVAAWLASSRRGDDVRSACGLAQSCADAASDCGRARQRGHRDGKPPLCDR
jgi:hypothetical protein